MRNVVSQSLIGRRLRFTPSRPAYRAYASLQPSPYARKALLEQLYHIRSAKGEDLRLVDARGCEMHGLLEMLISSVPDPPVFYNPSADSHFISDCFEPQLRVDRKTYAAVKRLGYSRERRDCISAITGASTLADALRVIDNLREEPGWLLSCLAGRFDASEDPKKLVSTVRAVMPVLEPHHAALVFGRLLATFLRVHHWPLARSALHWFLRNEQAAILRIEPSAWEYVALAISQSGSPVCKLARTDLLSSFIAALSDSDVSLTASTIVLEIVLAATDIVTTEQAQVLWRRRPALRAQAEQDRPKSDLNAFIWSMKYQGTPAVVKYWARRLHGTKADSDDSHEDLDAPSSELDELIHELSESDDADPTELLERFEQARRAAGESDQKLPVKAWTTALRAAGQLPKARQERLLAALDHFIEHEAGHAPSSRQHTRLTELDHLIGAYGSRVKDGRGYVRDSDSDRRQRDVMRIVGARIETLLGAGDHRTALSLWDERIAPMDDVPLSRFTLSLGCRALQQSDDIDEAINLVHAYALPPHMPVQPLPYAPRHARRPDDAISRLPPGARKRHLVELDPRVFNAALKSVIVRRRWLDVWSVWCYAPVHWSGRLYDADGVAMLIRAANIISAGITPLEHPPWLTKLVEHGLWQIRTETDERPSDDWTGRGAWRRAREVFWEVVMGNRPEFRPTVKSPVSGGQISRTAAWLVSRLTPDQSHTLPGPLDLFDADGQDELTAARYPSVIPNNKLFHEFFSLAGVHGFADEIPLALAYMRAYGVQPERSTLRNAIILYEQAGDSDRPKMQALTGFLIEWVGEEQVPTVEEISRFVMSSTVRS